MRVGVVRGADAVKVENPAATVFLCVRKHIDIIVKRHMRRHVAQTLEIGHHLVAFRIEGIETRAAGRIRQTFSGDGHARIVGGSPTARTLKRAAFPPL